MVPPQPGKDVFLFLVLFPKVYLYVVVICLQEGAILKFLGNFICIDRNLYLDAVEFNA